MELIKRVVASVFGSSRELQTHFGCVGRSVPVMSIRQVVRIEGDVAQVLYEIAPIREPKERLELQAVAMQATFKTVVLLRLDTEESIHVVSLSL